MVHDHLVFMDELKDAGASNILGAAKDLTREFPELSTAEAVAVMLHWVDTYEARHGAGKEV